jgi:hypothetical protein
MGTCFRIEDLASVDEWRHLQLRRDVEQLAPQRHRSAHGAEKAIGIDESILAERAGSSHRR